MSSELPPVLRNKFTAEKKPDGTWVLPDEVIEAVKAQFFAEYGRKATSVKAVESNGAVTLEVE